MARAPDIVGYLNQGVRHEPAGYSKSFHGPAFGTGKISRMLADPAMAGRIAAGYRGGTPADQGRLAVMRDDMARASGDHTTHAASVPEAKPVAGPEHGNYNPDQPRDDHGPWD